MVILRKKSEDEDYWDKYEDYSLESSSEGSECNGLSLDLTSSDEEEEGREIIRDNRSEEGARKGLRVDEGWVLLETKKHIFEPVWRNDVGGHIRGVRGSGSSATREREIRLRNPLLVTNQLWKFFQLNKTKDSFSLSLHPYLIYPKVHFLKWGKRWELNLSL